MVVVTLNYHPSGLGPLESCEAYRLHEEGLSFEDIRDEVSNLNGDRPSNTAVSSAVKRVDAMKKRGVATPTCNYDKCGRKFALTPEQQKSVVDFVKKWNNKRFCTCAYVKRALNFTVTRRTICNVLTVSTGAPSPRKFRTPQTSRRRDRSLL